MESVIILLDEMLGLIADCSSEVTYKEAIIISYFTVFFQLGFSWKVKPEVTGLVVKYLLCEVLIIRLWQLGLFIQETKYSILFGLYQVDAVLVVDKANVFNSESFLDIQFLFILQNPLIEKLLELFVTVIDAELFETVDSEVFEARNVQHTDVVT